MFKVKYLGDVNWFDSFDTLKKYFWHPECEDVNTLQERLRKEADGMAYPKIEEINC